MISATGASSSCRNPAFFPTFYYLNFYMKIKIAIYGGTHLTPLMIAFLTILTKQLLKYPEVVLVSGGFDYHINAKKRLSVDKVVMTTAEKTLGYPAFNDRFETWISKDNDRPGVVRFKKGKLTEIAGSTQARRFSMVKHIDALITIAGMGNTRSVTELALAIDKPVLPVAFSGGESALLWKKYKTDIQQQLNIPESMQRLLERKAITKDGGRAAKKIADFMMRSVKKNCLVLMPFKAADNHFYDAFLKKTIMESNYTDYRIDRNDAAGNIPQLFRNSLDNSRSIIIDITGFNPNVMYELGHVHAKNMVPLIILRTGKGRKNIIAELPFYLRQEMIVKAPDTVAGYKTIQAAVAAFLRGER